MTGAYKGEARSILRVTAMDTGTRIPGKRQTAGQILTVWQRDLHPDPSINKKLKLSLCNRGKGRADSVNAERFTFIDCAKVVTCKNIVAKNTDS